MAKDESQQYVDWTGLRYYDARVKEHIAQKYSSKEESQQIRTDIEQAETRIENLEKSTQTVTQHIITHVEELDKTTKELVASVEKLTDDLKDVSGGVLPSDIATKDFVLDEIEKAKLASTIPTEDYITEEELNSRGYLTSSDIPHIPTKVSELDNDAGYLTQHQDLSGYAKLEDIPDVSRFLETIPEEYVTEEELSNKGYITEHQSLEGLATEEFVNERLSQIVLPDLSNYATKDDIPDVSSFLTNVPEYYVTESELADQGFVTSEAISGMATKVEVENLVTRIVTFENNVSTNYVTIENAVTKEELNTSVADVVSAQVESMIDEKIEEVITDGATVSAIAYETF